MAKVLIVGSGGREHAIAYKFYKEGHEVHMAGINPAVEEFGVCEALTEDQYQATQKQIVSTLFSLDRKCH